MNETEQYILLTLAFLKVVLEAAKINGWEQGAIDAITASITELESVQGTPVTWQQLQGLRFTPQW